MKTNVYVVFDSVAGFYNKPFFMVNDQVAERAIMDLVADPNTDVSRHPSDFGVFKIGTYDDQTANFELHEPTPFLRCHEVKAKLLAGQEQFELEQEAE